MLTKVEVSSTPSFADLDEERQIKTATDFLPYKWKHGGRDNINSIGTILAVTRDHKLYLKCGYSSWEEYCMDKFHIPSAIADNMIITAEMLKVWSYLAEANKLRCNHV